MLSGKAPETDQLPELLTVSFPPSAKPKLEKDITELLKEVGHFHRGGGVDVG